MFFPERASIEILDVLSFERANNSIITKNKYCDVLSYRLEGESRFCYDNHTIDIHKDDLLYIQKLTSYAQTTASERIIAIHLKTSGLVLPTMTVIPCGYTLLIRDSFMQMEIIWRKHERGYYYRCMQLLYKMLWDLNKENNNYNNETIRKCIQQLHQNIENYSFSVKEAVTASGYSEAYFRKLFRKHTDKSPNQYLNAIRIEKSLSYLATGNYSVKQVSAMVGFLDYNYFCVVFRKQLGCAPLTYVRTHFECR